MSLRADVEALAAMERDSAGPGEAASAEWIAGRLRDLGAQDVSTAAFRYQSTYAVAHAAHVLAALIAVHAPRRLRSALAVGALLSLELEVSGRKQWLRALLPAGVGHNVTARLAPRASPGTRRRKLVLVAHHDAAQTGLMWQPQIAELGSARRLARRRIDPFMGLTAAGMLCAAVGARLPARALLGLSLLADADIARSPTVPGASDNATGVAAVLELAQRLVSEPLGAEVIVVLAGCEESGMGGMASFVEQARLDPACTLVLGLDTLGAGEPIVCSGEGAILEHRYREQDLELADRGAARAGLPAPQRWRIGAWTDPILAVYAGIPAISLLSIGPRGLFSNYHRMTDTAERVDWDCVERCVELAWGIAREWAG